MSAVLFDLDGTLYNQRRLRRLMLLELLQHPVRRPLTAVRDFRLISAYRRAQETLRDGSRSDDLELAQLSAAADRVGVPLDQARLVIDEWMHQRPQRYLRRCRAAGLVSFLAFLHERRIPLAVLSDYRISDKLVSLEIDRFFAFTVCAADREVGAFKPAPAGFLHACSRFDLAPDRVLYIGDRHEVDGVGAVGAGLDAVIVSGSGPPATPLAGCRVIRSFEELHRELKG